MAFYRPDGLSQVGRLSLLHHWFRVWGLTWQPWREWLENKGPERKQVLSGLLRLRVSHSEGQVRASSPLPWFLSQCSQTYLEIKHPLFTLFHPFKPVNGASLWFTFWVDHKKRSQVVLGSAGHRRPRMLLTLPCTSCLPRTEILDFLDLWHPELQRLDRCWERWWVVRLEPQWHLHFGL